MEIDVWNGDDVDEEGESKGKRLKDKLKDKWHSRGQSKHEPVTEPQPEKDELAPPSPWKAGSKRAEPRVLHGMKFNRAVQANLCRPYLDQRGFLSRSLRSH